ncbi:MAG: DNA mismatch repair protein MutS, partial [SAR324 cluster bacterium]|nr:DNA mismatch repair protein MutS [SAR324 cluster bacterium]
TRTPMGARLLRRWLAQPLLDGAAIEARLAAVAELAENQVSRDALREVFARIRDMERIIGRVNLSQAGIADVLALREALGGVQFLPPLLGELGAQLLRDLAQGLDPMEDIYSYLRERFFEEPSLKLGEGGYIGEGVIAELDALRKLARNSKQVISALEAREREKTGIASLKVRYNRVFGYYLEISKVHQQKVPQHYVRKQTLINAERYTLPELEELEEKILGAEERIAELEYAEFQQVRTILRGYVRRMQSTAARIAALDVLVALAEAAHRYAYVRPQLVGPEQPRRLSIRGGRHPVIERIAFDERFIPNDVEMSADAAQILLITGPNMAGKSTVMRQVALIQLMAQAGAFVPAEAAELPLIDRIFTRVGATDSLSRGQSTFMMEMNEAANILNNATPRSLIVLDEIGRGTSTYDGISIAWAMVEHLHRLGALTLFATHYHELTQLARELPRLINFNMSIQEDGERLVFTRKLNPGETDKSYGIQVARLAGLPAAVLKRAREVMDTLVAEGNGSPVLVAPAGASASRASTERAARARQQLSFLADAHPMLEQIRSLDLNELTPREALSFLYAAQSKLEKGEQ